MSYNVRSISESEVREFRRMLALVFGGNPDEDDEAGDVRLTSTLDLARTHATFDGETMVGTAATYDLQFSIPGGEAAVGGLTMVTVRPTHTRRGVMTAMIGSHLDGVRDRGEMLSALWASQASIYGRFGYGKASIRAKIEFDARLADIAAPDPGIEVDVVDRSEAVSLIPEFYGSARTLRPGMLARSEAWWERRVFHDPKNWRGGYSEYRFAIARRGGRVLGYLIYRQKDDWPDGIPAGANRISEMVTADDDARLSLWHFIATVDLFPHVEWSNAPIDEPLLWTARDSRQIHRREADGIWVRIMDVPAALGARSYQFGGSIVIEVDDPRHRDEAGIYRLEAGPDGALCEPTGAAADVTLDLSTLSALYLGGQNASAMARAGLIAGDAERIRLLDRLMAWDPMPWCPEVF